MVATDNCGASSTQTFALTVGVIGAPKITVGNGAASGCAGGMIHSFSSLRIVKKP